MKKLILTFSNLILALLLVACDEATNTTSPAATAIPTTSATTNAPIATTVNPTTSASITTIIALTTATTTQPATTSQPSAEAVVRQFVDAANRNDAQAVANSFAPDAHFDSVGRIYQGRSQIMDRFLIPEVLNIGGRYEIVSVKQDGEAITFEFNFRAGSSFEHFTYRCIVRGGQIQDEVGRYVTT